MVSYRFQILCIKLGTIVAWDMKGNIIEEITVLPNASNYIIR